MLEVGEEAVPVTVMGDVEVLAEAVAEAEVMTMTTTMMTPTMTPQLRPLRGHPDADVDDEPTGSSMTPKCNNNWLKSCKINVRRPQVDALQVSPPPTRSRRHTKTDDALR